MNKDQSYYVLGGVIFVIGVVAAFFVGMRYQTSRMSPFALGNRGTMRMMWGRPMMGAGMMQFGMRGTMSRATVGTVESVNGNQLTIKFSNGVTQTMQISSTATVTKTSNVGINGIAVGDQVAVSGQNTNGTYTVTNVRINPPTANPPAGGPTPTPTTTAQ